MVEERRRDMLLHELKSDGRRRVGEKEILQLCNSPLLREEKEKKREREMRGRKKKIKQKE